MRGRKEKRREGETAPGGYFDLDGNQFSTRGEATSVMGIQPSTPRNRGERHLKHEDSWGWRSALYPHDHKGVFQSVRRFEPL